MVAVATHRERQEDRGASLLCVRIALSLSFFFHATTTTRVCVYTHSFRLRLRRSEVHYTACACFLSSAPLSPCVVVVIAVVVSSKRFRPRAGQRRRRIGSAGRGDPRKNGRERSREQQEDNFTCGLEKIQCTHTHCL